MFDLCGYSERGMLNALFYDMRAGVDDADRLSRLQAFLSLCRFPPVGPYRFFRRRWLPSSALKNRDTEVRARPAREPILALGKAGLTLP
jgi:hypothetical protein